MKTSHESSEATLHLARSGYRSTLVAQIIKLACKLTGVIFLSRLVSPAEHGLFVMAASLLSFLVLFRDLGTNVAAVQIATLSQGQATALWQLQGLLGIVLAGATVALAPLWARFFAEAQLPPLLVILGTSFILAGFSGWPRISLSRELRFKDLNRIEIAGAVAGTVAMVALGLAGGGVYALVSYPIVSEAVMLTIGWLACTSRPHGRADWNGLGSLLRTGLGVTGYNLLLYPLQQLDTLLTGRWFGPQALGFYNRAGQLLVQPTTHLAAPFNDVLLSTLSRLGPDSPAFTPHLRSTANTIAHFTLPFIALCIALPDEVVRIALGAGWAESAELLRWLAIGAAPSFLTATIYPLCVTSGHSSRLVALSAVTLLTTGMLLFLARDHGVLGLARALATGNLLLLGPRLWWSTRGTPVSLADYLHALRRPVVTATIFGLSLALGRSLGGDRPWLVGFSLSIAAGTLAVIVSAMLSSGLREELRALRSQLPFARASD